jgi:hypothetical protein
MGVEKSTPTSDAAFKDPSKTRRVLGLVPRAHDRDPTVNVDILVRLVLHVSMGPNATVSQ